MLVCFESRVIHSEGILLKIPQLHGILPGQTPTGTVIKRTVMEDTEGILRFNLKLSDFRNCWSAWKFDKLMNYDEMLPFIWGWKFWLRPYQWVHLETAGSRKWRSLSQFAWQVWHIPIHFPRSKFFLQTRYVLRNWPSTTRHRRVDFFVLQCDRTVTFNCRVNILIFFTPKVHSLRI